MTAQTEYLINETRWLLSFGRPPVEIARQLNRAPNTIYQIANRYELDDIRDAFSPYSSGRRKA